MCVAHKVRIESAKVFSSPRAGVQLYPGSFSRAPRKACPLEVDRVSLNISLRNATSGLLAAQTELRAISDNIANVNTPGYVRKVANLQHVVAGGQGSGVQVSGIQRITDQFLQAAGLNAASDQGNWKAQANYLDNAQNEFGDPSGANYYFSRLDKIFTAFSTVANDPSSGLLRSQTLSTLQDFLGETSRINGELAKIGKTVEAQAGTDINQINDLLSQINGLNKDISRARLAGGDSTGSENLQSGLVDTLATLMNVKVSQRQNGGVTLRSTEGFELAGDTAAKLSYNQTSGTKSYVAIEYGPGQGNPQPIQITGGELRGLMDTRDKTIPDLSNQLGEFAARAADQLNAAHNASAASPAPASLTGRNTGLDLPTAVSHFTGTSTVAVVNAAGVVQTQVAIDFTAGTMSVNGGAASAFTPASFLTDLNTALGASGTASFSNGALSISAATGGVAIDEGTSNKAGAGFSHFFGLNDLVRSTGFTNYRTGLTATDANGFTAGDTISFRIAQGDGRPVFDVTVPIPAGGTMQNLVTALNNTTTGVGLYGAFNLDANGTLAFTPSSGLDVSLAVTKDNSQRGPGGPPLSQLFGLGVVERSSRADRLALDRGIANDPTKLALAQLDLTVAAGKPAIRLGDGRGGQALAHAGSVATLFDPAGQLASITATVSSYASQFGGAIGRQSAAADAHKSTAVAVANEANARLQSVESVNLDEELVRLTTFQQAYNASARMIQATKELFDVLNGLI